MSVKTIPRNAYFKFHSLERKLVELTRFCFLGAVIALKVEGFVSVTTVVRVA